MGDEPVEWGPERAGELAGLLAAAAPHERLTADELLGVLWEDPGVVLGTDAGDGAVAAVTRRYGDVVAGYVRLVAVHPEAQRRGLGRRLLGAAEAWLVEQGAAVAALGGEAPVYLWPGVDVTAVGMLCLAEAAGYQATGSELDMSLPTTFRAPVPEGVAVRRATSDDDVDALRDLVGRHWPGWRVELDRAVASATVHGAFDPVGAPVGFCCHSVLRTGWLGPMGTDPAVRGGGVGAALVSAVCTDLMVARHDRVEICWVGPVRFYAKLGATVSRSFRSMSRPLG